LHPLQWTAIVVGVVLVGSVSFGMSGPTAFEWIVIGGAMAAYALAALVGALLTRRMVSRYDATGPGDGRGTP
jgi:hypothetical protein